MLKNGLAISVIVVRCSQCVARTENVNIKPKLGTDWGNLVQAFWTPKICQLGY